MGGMEKPMIPEWVAALHGHALNYWSEWENEEGAPVVGYACSCGKWREEIVCGGYLDRGEWAEHVVWEIATSVVPVGRQPAAKITIESVDELFDLAVEGNLAAPGVYYLVPVEPQP